MKSNYLFLSIAITLIATYSSAQQTGTFTDSRNGKVYKTVKIGTQTWMAENLAYKPNKGDCRAYKSDDKNLAAYGYYYNWDAAMAAVPPGWHIPSNAEWITLIDYLGGYSIAGGKLKQKGTTLWKAPNAGATNSSGFTALPLGSCHENNSSMDEWDTSISYDFIAFGDMAWFWTSDAKEKEANYVAISSDKSSVSYSYTTNKQTEFPVRCVKD